MRNQTTRFEENNAERINELVAEMLVKMGEIDIDKIEVVFEKGCSRCKMNKECKNCAVYGAFVDVLNR